MKNIIAIALLVSSSVAANARDPSGPDSNIRSASTKAVDVYMKTGIGGLFGAVSECYAKLGAAKKPADNAIEFCVALDVSGIFIDDGAARANGFPRDQRFTDAEASNRMHAVLMKFGVSRSPADTQAYLGTRAPIVQRYTNLAMR